MRLYQTAGQQKPSVAQDSTFHWSSNQKNPNANPLDHNTARETLTHAQKSEHRSLNYESSDLLVLTSPKGQAPRTPRTPFSQEAGPQKTSGALSEDDAAGSPAAWSSPPLPLTLTGVLASVCPASSLTSVA